VAGTVRAGDRPAVNGRVARNHTLGHRVRGIARGKGVPRTFQGSAIRLVMAANDFDKCRFSGAIRPHQGGHGAKLQRQIDAPQNIVLPKRLCQPPYLQRF